MEDKIRHSKEKILNKLDLPDEIVLDVPQIIVTGNKKITIENYKGLLNFSDNLVKIKSRIGNISIVGRGFEILFITDSTITLKGVFQAINYEAINNE